MHTKKRQKKKSSENWWAGPVIVAAIALAAIIVSVFDFFLAMEYNLYDWNFQLRGPKSVEDTEIALVVIDEQTSDSLSFPFDRRHYAELIRNLNELGAHLIIFDIGFSSRGIRPESDSLMKAVITDAGNVILSGKIDLQYHSGLREAIREIIKPANTVADAFVPFGLINDLIDFDSATRRYPLYISYQDTAYLSLAMKIIQVNSGLTFEDFNFEAGDYFNFGETQVPTLESNSTLINFYGPSGTFPTFSFIDVLSGVYNTQSLVEELTPEEAALLKEFGTEDLFEDLTAESPFLGKIVMVGASADDLQDNKFTPFFTSKDPRKTPGVEVHANALQMFMHGDFIRRVSYWWILGGIVLLSAATYLIGRFLSQWIGLIGSALFLIMIAAIGLILFAGYGLWLREIPLMLTIALGYPANLVYRIILAQREKAMIRGMFAHYVPKKVVGELISNPDMLKLGGEKRVMSVLFCDVAGFTTISERLPPEELTALLNEYLTAMTNVILEHDGIIDKYEGDLVMAEFGAPVWYEDHAVKCCRAALGMQQKLAEMREVWRSQGRDELHSRVGLNTGPMIVGNMGSEEVFDYTVMGDSVNLASRLEGANKSYNTTIMVGHETARVLGERFVVRSLDFLRVKGKTEPVEVFELLGENPRDFPETKLIVLNHFKSGIEAYRSMEFQKGLESFKRALDVDPKDGPSKVYIERCENYLIDPPPPDWDGVFTLTEK